MAEVFMLEPSSICIKELEDLLVSTKTVALSTDAINGLSKCYEYLQKRLDGQEEPIYGINTGFGALHNVKISADKLSELQENLVMSHACGTGDPVPEVIVKLMLVLKVQSLIYGHSGVRVETVQRLLDFYNHKALPVIYTQGSLGASGDLAPLAHMALPLLGKGEFTYRRTKKEAHEVLRDRNWKPLRLRAKEGLALLNGTQFMSAYGVYILIKLDLLSVWADVIASLSLDAFNAGAQPFHPLLQKIRPHKGQNQTAARILKLLAGSELQSQPKKQVQDPYSFRCIPQVHGASKDSFEYVKSVFETEINSVTDNPNIFVDEEEILSGGNFHGQPLALALDFLSLAMAELGSISERRIYQLISGSRGLPEFLVQNPGLHSGLMIPQYTAAALASQNKQLCTPASVDSITSSNGQEDHVSMGANAAVKCLQLYKNLEGILAIELFSSIQALEFRKPHTTSPFLQNVVTQYRKKVPTIGKDRPFFRDIQLTRTFINSWDIRKEI